MARMTLQELHEWLNHLNKRWQKLINEGKFAKAKEVQEKIKLAKRLIRKREEEIAAANEQQQWVGSGTGAGTTGAGSEYAHAASGGPTGISGTVFAGQAARHLGHFTGEYGHAQNWIHETVRDMLFVSSHLNPPFFK